MVSISEKALIQRINRKLRHESEALKKCRGDRDRHEVGDFYIVDHSLNAIVAKHVDIEQLGRELRVLAPTQTVAA